jgi:hypothetical protein
VTAMTPRLAFCFFLFGVFAHAQGRGTISGIITDSSGGSVPGGAVTLRNPATGFTRNITSGEDGAYSFRISRPANTR